MKCEVKRLKRARKLYLTAPAFRTLAKDIMADLLERRPEGVENFARHALLEADADWHYVEPEQPAHEYAYERAQEAYR